MAAAMDSDYPSRKLAGLAELIGIALVMEEEAAERYDRLARDMRMLGDRSLAQTFGDLAELERRHGAELAALAVRLGKEPVRPAVGSAMPESFGEDEAAGLSSYRALGIAVRNEEKAFVFYSYIAALNESDAEVRDWAESFAREELSHVAQLRVLRRRAFHQARGGRGGGAPPARSLAEFRLMSSGLEQGSAELARAVRLSLEAFGRPDDALLLLRAEEGAARRAAELGAGRQTAFSASSAAEEARGQAPASLEAALGLFERDGAELLETYLQMADQAASEAWLQTAQDLAQGAMSRLALVRELVRRGFSP